jgi:tetratricopeptide (TPR) repeat protein
MENSFNSLKKLGDDNYQETNYEEAVKYYTQAIETDDDNIYFYAVIHENFEMDMLTKSIIYLL